MKSSKYDICCNVPNVYQVYRGTLYLDRKREQAGPGFATTAALLRRVIDAVADKAMPLAAAAE